MTPEEQAGQKRDMEAKASKHASKRVQLWGTFTWAQGHVQRALASSLKPWKRLRSLPAFYPRSRPLARC